MFIIITNNAIFTLYTKAIARDLYVIYVSGFTAYIIIWN